jgi:hypothetical protein
LTAGRPWHISLRPKTTGRTPLGLAPGAASLAPSLPDEDRSSGRSEEEDLEVAARHAPLAPRADRTAVVEDKQSGEFRRPHHVDLKTGMYRGRQVIVKREQEEAGDD